MHVSVRQGYHYKDVRDSFAVRASTVKGLEALDYGRDAVRIPHDFNDFLGWCSMISDSCDGEGSMSAQAFTLMGF